MRWWGELSSKQRQAILIAWPLVVVGVFGYLTYGALGELGEDPKLESVAFLPRAEVKKDLWTEIDRLDKQIKAEEKVLERRAEVEAEFEDARERMAALKSRLPSEKQKEKMRERIQEMVNEVPEEVGRVEFVGISIQEESAAGGRRGRRRGGREQYSTVTYQLELEADMNGLIWYLDRVERHPRFMAVHRFDVTPGGIQVDADNLTLQTSLHSVNLDLITYVLHDKEG